MKKLLFLRMLVLPAITFGSELKVMSPKQIDKENQMSNELQQIIRTNQTFNAQQDEKQRELIARTYKISGYFLGVQPKNNSNNQSERRVWW